MVTTTHQEHRRLIKWLLLMPDRVQALPLPDALVAYIMNQRQVKAWRWSTTIKTMASCQGTLASLPLYRRTPHGVLLKTSVVWVNAMKAAARAGRQELPRQPTPATWGAWDKCLR